MRISALTACALVALVAAAVVGLGIAARPVQTDGTLPFETVTDEDAAALLASLRQGCDLAAAAVHSGVGTLTVHAWAWRPNGDKRETETTYSVASQGDRFKAVSETRYVEDEWAPAVSQTNTATAPTARREEIAFNGETITFYEPDEGNAIIGDAASPHLGKLLQSVRLYTRSPGHAVPVGVLDLKPASEACLPAEPRVLGRDLIDGEECVVCEASAQVRGTTSGSVTSISRYWINPARGYSLVKAETYMQQALSLPPDLLSSVEVDTVPAADTLWRISSWRQDVYAVDFQTSRPYLSLRSTASFADDYQLNAPVTEDMLTINLPSGTKVYNELIDAQYTVP